MTRALYLGIAIFFAVVGIALMSGEKQAVAGHRCHGCSGPACDGGHHCGGFDACHGNRCHGRRAHHRRRCHGRNDCCGVVDPCACHGGVAYAGEKQAPVYAGEKQAPAYAGEKQAPYAGEKQAPYAGEKQAPVGGEKQVPAGEKQVPEAPNKAAFRFDGAPVVAQAVAFRN